MQREAAHSDGFERPMVTGADDHTEERPGETVTVRIRDLVPADSPRIGGEDEEHARTLAAIGERLPPILVLRGSMRVIDGMHRVTAAIMNGADTIEVRLFDGTAHEAFLEAVRANTSHGKPLTLAERKSSAQRILIEDPTLSDRYVGTICGLAAKTVSSIRRSTAEIPQSNVRMGRDGRVRPVDSDTMRARAAEVISQNPDSSLRDVSNEVGLSPSTVGKVRARLRHHLDPRMQVERERERNAARPQVDLDTVLEDNALGTGGDESSALLTMLRSKAVDPSDWSSVVDNVPLSRVYVVADLARSFARAWEQLANLLETRVRSERAL